ncbi:hypothetical protein OH77DRAFT_245245 [Trametes cingulata]|nr:hypothetical protein OH77DRAFT_245245 [Trametes cingulata]
MHALVPVVHAHAHGRRTSHVPLSAVDRTCREREKAVATKTGRNRARAIERVTSKIRMNAGRARPLNSFCHSSLQLALERPRTQTPACLPRPALVLSYPPALDPIYSHPAIPVHVQDPRPARPSDECRWGAVRTHSRPTGAFWAPLPFWAGRPTLATDGSLTNGRARGSRQRFFGEIH